MTKIQPIGRFNRIIEVQALSKAPDGAGGYTESWATAYSTFAYVGPVKSWRALQLLQNVQNASYEIQIRFTPSRAITKDNRFFYEGKPLILNSIEQATEGRKRFWVIIATEQG